MLEHSPTKFALHSPTLLGLGLLEDRAIVLGPLPRYLEEVFTPVAAVGEAAAVDLHERGNLPLPTASDYLGKLYRLRVVLRERKTLSGGGGRFVYAAGIWTRKRNKRLSSESYC